MSNDLIIGLLVGACFAAAFLMDRPRFTETHHHYYGNDDESDGEGWQESDPDWWKREHRDSGTD